MYSTVSADWANKLKVGERDKVKKTKKGRERKKRKKPDEKKKKYIYMKKERRLKNNLLTGYQISISKKLKGR